MEATPDTVISLTNGQKFVVIEDIQDVVGKIIEFRRATHSCAPVTEAR